MARRVNKWYGDISIRQIIRTQYQTKEFHLLSELIFYYYYYRLSTNTMSNNNLNLVISLLDLNKNIYDSEIGIGIWNQLTEGSPNFSFYD